jgi:hypothetical protein
VHHTKQGLGENLGPLFLACANSVPWPCLALKAPHSKLLSFDD